MLTQIIQSENQREQMHHAANQFVPSAVKRKNPLVRHHVQKLPNGRRVALICKDACVMLIETDERAKNIQVISDMDDATYTAALKDGITQIRGNARSRKPKAQE